MNKKIIQDKRNIECIICLFFLSFSHFIQYFRSDFMLQPLIRGIFATTAFIFTFFTGKKYWNILLFAWAVSIMYWNRFSNYTSFILILISLFFNPETKWLYIFLYEVLVIVFCILYRDTFTHFIIHNIGCFFFYTCYCAVNKLIDFLRNKIDFLHKETIKLRQENKELQKIIQENEMKKQKRLDLTDEEFRIISELCDGREIKQIDICSQNTVYVRLREARRRNNCVTNEELKTRFIADNQQ